MLTLEHVQEVLQKALASIEEQRTKADELAQADQHQYVGALEGARFVVHLLESKLKELIHPGASDAADAGAQGSGTSSVEQGNAAADANQNPAG